MACIHIDRPHSAEIDQERVVLNREATYVVAATANRHFQPGLGRETYRPSATSARFAHAAIAAGRRSIIAFQTRRAVSKWGAPGNISAPCRFIARESQPIANRGIEVSANGRSGRARRGIGCSIAEIVTSGWPAKSHFPHESLRTLKAGVRTVFSTQSGRIRLRGERPCFSHQDTFSPHAQRFWRRALAAPAHGATPGEVDTTFGQNGRTVVAENSEAIGLRLPDGSLLVASQSRETPADTGHRGAAPLRPRGARRSGLWCCRRRAS